MRERRWEGEGRKWKDGSEQVSRREIGREQMRETVRRGRRGTALYMYM